MLSLYEVKKIVESCENEIKIIMAGCKFGDDWCLNKIIWDNLMALCIVRINCVVLTYLFRKSYT